MFGGCCWRVWVLGCVVCVVVCVGFEWIVFCVFFFFVWSRLTPSGGVRVGSVVVGGFMWGSVGGCGRVCFGGYIVVCFDLFCEVGWWGFGRRVVCVFCWYVVLVFCSCLVVCVVVVLVGGLLCVFAGWVEWLWSELWVMG